MNGLAPRRTPTEEDRARMLAEHVAQVEARDLGQRNAEARRIGPIALATVGVEAWSRFGDDEAKGGVIVAITELRDPETGEIGRQFLCLHPYKGVDKWECSLPESEVVDQSFQISDTSRLVRLARRLAAEVAAPTGNLATGRDVRYARWCLDLLVVAMGGGR